MDSPPEISAEGMLAEIQSESLQHLLTCVRNQSSPLRPAGLASLDSCLEGSHPLGSTKSSLRWGDVLEIQGPAGSGKSHLLYHLVITCILPAEHLNLKYPGWGKLAVIYDTDGTFDIRRLYCLLINKLTSLAPQEQGEHTDAGSRTDIEELAQHCLQNLYIFRPTTSMQLASSLLRLPTLIFNQSPSQQRELGIVAVDSLSAFHWKDRLTVEHLRAAQSSPPVGPMHYVLNALQKIRTSYFPVIILTNWALNPISKPGPSTTLESDQTQQSPFYKQHLFPFPTPFTQSSGESPKPNIGNTMNTTVINPKHQLDHQFPTPGDLCAMEAAHPFPLTYHITLLPINLPSIPATLSLTEACEQDNSERQPTLSLGQVQCLVRTPHSPKIGRFTFRTQDHLINSNSDE